MKNSRGITMASLVIMIAAIVLLAAMAIGGGYSFLKKASQTNQEAFVKVLSSAVIKRENNHVVNSGENPRIGYYIKTADALKEIIDNIPTLNGNAEMMHERGEWYIVDSAMASKLGVKGASDYVDVFDSTNTDKMTVALVDYISGNVYMVSLNDATINDIQSGIDDSSIEPIDGHIHDYNHPDGATCTEDMKCLICGYVKQVALGHDYGSEGLSAEWIDDEFHAYKECQRCHMKGGYERHTGLDSFCFHKSGDGGWYHYNGCSVCGWNMNGDIIYQLCTKEYQLLSDTRHAIACVICGHREEMDHNFVYNYIDENYHECVCSECGYVKSQFEAHTDADGDGICDKCDSEIIENESPVLESVTIKNKEYPESRFITNGETVVLTFVADKRISTSNVTICGYGNDKINYSYSADRKTCIVEMPITEDMTIPQDTEITFSITCQSETTHKWMEASITKTSDGSKLIYDSIAPAGEYIVKSAW